MSAPEGFTLSGQALAEHPEIAKLTAALAAPQAALRARINAVVCDLILLGVLWRVLRGVLAPGASVTTQAGVFLLLQFAYFFVWELYSGQTLGKRAFHVRVTTVDGSPATPAQIALRNVLRIVDALPYFYVSGLVSLIRTGPGRRQRIGDVAARTTVVLDPGAKAMRTPEWLLGAATILTTLLSAVIIVAVVGANTGPASGSLAAGPGDTPLPGRWSATGRTVTSVGYAAFPDAETWTVGRAPCDTGARCGPALTVQGEGEPPLTASLIRSPRAWLAVFPSLRVACVGEGGEPLTWEVRKAIALRFADGGREAQAEERDVSEGPRCGVAEAIRSWSAILLTGGG